MKSIQKHLLILFVFLFISSGLVLAQTVVIYGDTRSNPDQHRKVVAGIIKANPYAVFHTGDMVTNGSSDVLWAEFKDITSELRKKAQFYPAVGNHDGSWAVVKKEFDLPAVSGWYAADIGNIHFMVLNSLESLKKGSVQYNWLEAELQNANQKKQHKILLLHFPVYYSAKPLKEETEMRNNLGPLCDKYGVEIVFSGHKHNYTRSFYQKTCYVVTGGGAAPLYDNDTPVLNYQKHIKTYHFCKLTEDNGKLKVDVYDPDLKLLDHFEVE